MEIMKKIRQFVIIVGLLIIGVVFNWIGYNNAETYLHSRNDTYQHIQYIQRLSNKDTILLEYCECYTTWENGNTEYYKHQIVECKDYPCTQYYVMNNGTEYLYDTLNYSMQGGSVDLDRIKKEIGDLKLKPIIKKFSND